MGSRQNCEVLSLILAGTRVKSPSAAALKAHGGRQEVASDCWKGNVGTEPGGLSCRQFL